MYKIKRYISLLLSVLTIVSSLLIGCTAFADELVAINDVNFADKNFRKIVSDYCDTNGNNYLDSSERNRTVLSIPGYLDDNEVIESLKGIEYFTNLTTLYAGGIGLKGDLDVSNNTKLTRLSCGGNDLTTLKLGSLANLTYLDCSANELTALNVTGCPNLQKLQCYSNKIASIDLSKNLELILLYLEQNELETLNINLNVKLQVFHCSNNHIPELNLSSNTALDEITADDIGDQWISKDAYIRANRVYINYTFKDSSKLVSSSLDTVIDTDEGMAVASAYNGSAFSTDEADNIKKKIVDANKDVFDGFTYKYNVSNHACDDMSVNVVVTRGFYQVNFYLDETKTTRLSYALVSSGSTVTPPAVPEAALCKKYVSWSDNFVDINEDRDIYIIWKDDHDMVKNFNNVTGNIDVHCTKCDRKTVQFNFLAAYNSKEGDVNYVEVGDRNHDGVINAKDYAIIVKM